MVTIDRPKSGGWLWQGYGGDTANKCLFPFREQRRSDRCFCGVIALEWPSHSKLAKFNIHRAPSSSKSTNALKVPKLPGFCSLSTVAHHLSPSQPVVSFSLSQDVAGENACFKLNSPSSRRDLTAFRTEWLGEIGCALTIRVSRGNGFWLDHWTHTVKSIQENPRRPYNLAKGYLTRKSGPGTEDNWDGLFS